MNHSLIERCRRIDLEIHRALTAADPGLASQALPAIDWLATVPVVLVAARVARAVEDVRDAAGRLHTEVSWRRLGPAIVARCDETAVAPEDVLDFLDAVSDDHAPEWPDEDAVTVRSFIAGAFVALLATTDVVVDQSASGRLDTLDLIWP